MSDYKFTEGQLAWLKALESGEYKQAKEELQDYKGCYCCLGVGCRVAEDYGVDVKEKENGELLDTDLETQGPARNFLGLVSDCGHFRGRKSIKAIDIEVRDWILENLSLSQEQKELCLDDTRWCSSLVKLNDDVGLDFVQLAQVIRQFPEYLFVSNEENDDD